MNLTDEAELFRNAANLVPVFQGMLVNVRPEVASEPILWGLVMRNFADDGGFVDVGGTNVARDRVLVSGAQEFTTEMLYEARGGCTSVFLSLKLESLFRGYSRNSMLPAHRVIALQDFLKCSIAAVRCGRGRVCFQASHANVPREVLATLRTRHHFCRVSSLGCS